MHYKDLVPYTSIFIDASWKHFVKSAWWCLIRQSEEDETKEEEEVVKGIQQICASNKGYILPCLSVRSGLQLFLEIKKFPPSSEVIMSAINIPDMASLLHSHGLKIVSLDIDIEKMSPRVDLIPSLVTSKTCIILVANIYGRGYDIDPFVKMAKRFNLVLIEDWAEGFSGPNNLGHPEADLSMFSFGPIKNFTAFGGALMKVKNEHLYARMRNKHSTFPVQPHTDYLRRVLKYSLVYMLLNCPSIVKPIMYASHLLHCNHQKRVVSLLRGFPVQMLKRIRHRPCLALLRTLAMRLSSFQQHHFQEGNLKAEHAIFQLPSNALPVGLKAIHRNHWLFPVLVEEPSHVIRQLRRRGVDAYKGATQLDCVSSDAVLSNASFILFSTHPSTSSSSLTPQAQYLIDHVIYLPINKTVPLQFIDHICSVLSDILAPKTSAFKHSENETSYSSLNHSISVSNALDSSLSELSTQRQDSITKARLKLFNDWDSSKIYSKIVHSVGSSEGSNYNDVDVNKNTSRDDKEIWRMGLEEVWWDVVSEVLLMGDYANKCKL